MAGSKYHMISASSSSPALVEIALEKERSRLDQKLSNHGVDSNFLVQRTEYSASYTFDGEDVPTTIMIQFSVRSSEGWGGIEKKAKRAVNGESLIQYKATFHADQYLELSSKQRKALEPKRPTAAGQELFNDQMYRGLVSFIRR